MKIFMWISLFSAFCLCDGYHVSNTVFCDVINKFTKLNNRVNSHSRNCRRAAPTSMTRDCSQIQDQATQLRDGLFKINPAGGKGAFVVYCELGKGEGWLVIQRRIDGSRDFYRGWADYEQGFGDLSGEFWLGNDKISQITSQTNYELRIEMEDFGGATAFANYDSFRLGNASTSFLLQVSGFSGDKGNSLKTHNHMQFSTYDFDNDKSVVNCAQRFLGAWWYNDCMSSNLNGHYTDNVPSHGIVWETWKNDRLKHIVMKIRPKQIV